MQASGGNVDEEEAHFRAREGLRRTRGLRGENVCKHFDREVVLVFWGVAAVTVCVCRSFDVAFDEGSRVFPPC